ncbi:hypothetical protein [Frankia sp. Cj3]|uniref:hypothetical protein n=1 Tax=Frankia sp. Cj3 TaxID=2880976 RepID=UPI001EF6865A|nr:hypothetical protein [Frankia sp. Cj3]
MKRPEDASRADVPSATACRRVLDPGRRAPRPAAPAGACCRPGRSKPCGGHQLVDGAEEAGTARRSSGNYQQRGLHLRKRPAGAGCYTVVLTGPDAGYHAAAQRYWVAALHAAHSAGIPALGANVLKNMTLQLLDFDQRTDALTVADAALSAGKGSTPRTRAMLAVRKARAHAALGDRRDCTRALSDAETYLGKGERDDDPTWVRYFDRAEYCAQVAMTFVELGTPAPADRYFAAALDPTSGISRVRDRATYLIRHAAVQVDLGDLDHAHALAHQALPHLEEAPSARNGYRIGELRSRLAPHRADPRIRILDTRLTAAA